MGAMARLLLLLHGTAALRGPPQRARTQTTRAATKGFNFDVASWLKAPTTTIHEDVDDVDDVQRARDEVLDASRHNELLSGHVSTERRSVLDAELSVEAYSLHEAPVTLKPARVTQHTKHAEQISVDAAVRAASSLRPGLAVDAAIAAASAARSSADVSSARGRGSLAPTLLKAAKSIQWWLPGRQKRADRAVRAAEALAGLITLDDTATGRDLVRGTSTLTDEGMTPVVDAKQLSKAVSNLLRGGARRRVAAARLALAATAPGAPGAASVRARCPFHVAAMACRDAISHAGQSRFATTT